MTATQNLNQSVQDGNVVVPSTDKAGGGDKTRNRSPLLSADNGALLALAAAVFGIGYGLGKDTNSGTIEVLRERLVVSEKSEATQRAEITSLSVQLEKARGPAASGATATIAQEPTQTQATATSLEHSSKDAIEAEVRAGQTVRLFNGDVSIAVIGTNFEGSPLRDRVTASLGSLGKQSVVLEKADVGYSVPFNGYEVRVLSTGTSIANFLVTKLNSK